MGLQVILRSKDAQTIEAALGVVASQSELFPIKNAQFGLSIPTKVIDTVGEKAIFALLGKLEHFEL
jgi:hypothetical protein